MATTPLPSRAEPLSTNQHEQPPPPPPPFINSLTDLRHLSSAINIFQRRYDDLQGHLDYIRTSIDSKLPTHLISTPQTQLPLTPPTKPVVSSTQTPSTNNFNTTPTPLKQPKSETTPSSSAPKQSKPETTPSSNAPKQPQPKTTPKQSKPETTPKQSKPETTTPSSNAPKQPKPETTPSSNAPKQPKPETTPSSNAEKQVIPETTQSENAAMSELEGHCKAVNGKGLRHYLLSNLSDLKKIREEVPKALTCCPNPAKMVWECFGRFYLQGIKAYTKDSPMINGRKVSILALEVFLLMGCDDLQIDAEIKKEALDAAVAWRNRLKTEARLVSATEIDARGLLFLICCFGIPTQFRNDDIRDLIRASNVIPISHVLRRSSILLARIPEIIDGMVKNKMEIEAVNIALTFKIERSRSILKAFLRKETWRKQKDAQVSPDALNETNRRQLAKLKSVIKCLKRHKIDPSEFLPECEIEEKISSLEKEIANLDKKKTDEKGAPKRKADHIKSSNKSKTQKLNHSQVSGHVSPQQQNGPHEGLPQINFLDGGGFPGYINSFSAPPSVLLGSGAGPLPDTFAGLAPGVGPSGVMPAGSYAGPHGGVLNHSSQLYGWRGDAALNERFAGQPSAIGLAGGYRPSPSLEGFAGMPNHSSVGFSGRRSASDLYNFADSVIESELQRSSGGSRTGGTVPAHNSSYY